MRPYPASASAHRAGSRGNIVTEDLVFMLEPMVRTTGIDLDA